MRGVRCGREEWKFIMAAASSLEENTSEGRGTEKRKGTERRKGTGEGSEMGEGRE